MDFEAIKRGEYMYVDTERAARAGGDEGPAGGGEGGQGAAPRDLAPVCVREALSAPLADVELGVNINDSTGPFTRQLLTGSKRVETRDRRVLDRFVNQRVGLVRTGKPGGPKLVGYVVLGEPFSWRSQQEFEADADLHLVPREGSPFSEVKNGVKWGYPVIEATPLATPVAVPRGHQASIVYRPLREAA